MYRFVAELATAGSSAQAWDDDKADGGDERMPLGYRHVALIR